MAKSPMALSEWVSDEQLDVLFAKIDFNGQQVDSVVTSVVDDYCGALDEIMMSLERLLEKTTDLSDTQLEAFVVQIPVRLYFASTAVEVLGVRDDISRLLYKEAYNAARQEATGTVADKDSAAQQQTNTEALAAIVYSRAARQAKARLDAAYETLTALKKVVSARIAERSIAQSDVNGR